LALVKSSIHTPIGRALAKVLSRDSLILTGPVDLIAYSYDATGDRALPEAVVLPANTADAAALMCWAADQGIPVIPRGAGTNLSGGTVPVAGGIVLEMARAKQVLSVDLPRRRAVVGPGITNLALQNYLAPLGYCFAPDPASQKVSTLGGNVGENAGGPHCLKYGVTADHIEGLVGILSDGSIVRLGEMAEGECALGSTRALVGSEGTLAIFTEIMVRLEPLPPAVKTILAVYDRLEDAGRSVSEIIARRMLPATLELMDRTTLNVIEESFHLGYPTDAEGALLIELDGLAPGLNRQAAMIESICLDLGARTVAAAKDEDERARLWLGRRSAFGALARRSPSYSVQDATVPRDRLVEMMRHVEEVATRHDLEIAIVAHAGDGNLHPIVLYRTPTPERLAKVHEANGEIMRQAVAMGGTISGEHGVGIEKLDFVPLALDTATLDLMRRVKHAFDPDGRLNPSKAIPGAAPVHDQVSGGGAVAFVAGTLWPQGHGTRSSWALPDDKPNLQPAPASTQRGTLEIDSGNLTLRVLAGTPSAEVREALAQAGFWLPALDHGWHGTIGGDVATAQPAPTDAQLGGIGRWVLGGELVPPHGGPVHLGGKTMKNVTGYNLVPLLTGSYGQLGRINELTLRLWPRPEEDVTLTCSLSEWIGGLARMAASEGATAASAGWGTFDRLVRLTRPVAAWATGAPDRPAVVLIRLAGIAEDVAWATKAWMDALPLQPTDPTVETDPWRQWRQPWHTAGQTGHLREWRGCPTRLPGLLPGLATNHGPVAWSACLIGGNGYAAGSLGQLDGLAAPLQAAGFQYHRRGYVDAAITDNPVDRRLLAAFAPGQAPVTVGGERA